MTDTATPEKPAPNVSREIAVINQGNAVVPMPANFEQMTKFASMMSAGGAMVGVPFRDNPGACLGALMQAMRWGMDPYACSQKMYIASRTGDGPIAYEAQLVHAVLLKNAPIRKRPRFAFEGDGDSRVCIVTFQLVDDDEPVEYRSPPISKVRKPRDKGSPLWYDNPDQQLAYYTIRAAARLHFPDVIMGVYTPDEIEQVAQTQRIEGDVITLSGQRVDTDNIPEAEFSDGTAVLAKNAAKKKAASKGGQKVDGPGESEASGAADSGESAPTEGPAPAGGPASAEAGGSNTAAKPNEPEKTAEQLDGDILTAIENDVRAAKAGKRDIIIASRGALERIRQTSESPDLVKRAFSLLNRYELDQ